MPRTSIEASHGVDAERSTELEHVTVEYEDAPSACTLYPRRCSEADLLTHWITAEGDSFVDLSDAR